MKKLLLIIATLTILSGCKKEQPADKADLYPEVPLATASSSAMAVFQQNIAFYQMFVYRFDPTTNTWTNRIGSHFSTTSATDPTFIGFTNAGVADSGTAMFDMVRLYSTQTGSTNIRTVKINADQVLQFFPDYEKAKTGIVKVKTQDIVLTKSDASTFKIGISGSGTYDETSKVIDLSITFNEAAIGGTTRTFNYKMSPTALTL
ncbi:restriction endonuclease subunit S domain-containing protein [Pedobacter rhizosphaerae]|uniref:Uncharacterized protein n=1 Tax=Pedobacter rhizosphaerae TaxID=390241 RepID=A0A1H9LHD0_9SPHI|nr:hypothetical protein [Pedobacter rhizosphaerae]SER10627.1 hypothetical protein SAMN04488023_104140 [Pedobacter rhizosphaerae]